MEPYKLKPLPGEDDDETEPWVAPPVEKCTMCKARSQRQCFIHAGDLSLLPDDRDGRCRHCDQWCGRTICDQCWAEQYNARPDAHVGASYLYERI